MAEAEHEVDVGGPGADPLDLSHQRLGRVGLHRAERIEVEPTPASAAEMARTVRIFGPEKTRGPEAIFVRARKILGVRSGN